MLFKVLRGENLPASDVGGKSDPFVRILYDGRDVGVTPRVKRNLNPRWDFEVAIPLTHAGGMYVVLEVYDKDELSTNDLLGAMRVPFPDWRPHVDEYQRRLQALETKRHEVIAAPPSAKTINVRHMHSANPLPLDAIRESRQHSNTSSPNAAQQSTSTPTRGDVHRRSRSLNSFGPGLEESFVPLGLRATVTNGTSAVKNGESSPAASGVMDMIKPVLIWSLLVKGSAPQGRVLCSVQYEERDLKYFVNMPYGTDIHDVFLPQNARFKEAYRHLPRSWHPDLNVRQQELAAMHAGTPKDCLFPWHEKLLHMIEEVTVTFHVNESNQGVLATLVLTNYRLWFVPYRKVKGLLHEDVHTIAIAKILKAAISQQKRGSNVNTVTVLELENMDAGHYHVTLSPISRLRDSVRDYSRDAEAKRIKQLHNLVAELEWLKLENTFCAPYDLNHLILDSKDEQTAEAIARFYEPVDGTSSGGSVAKPPPSLSRSSTTQCNPNDHADVVNSFTKPPVVTEEEPPQRSPPLMHHVSESTLHVAKPTPAHAMTARRRIRYDVEAEFRRQGATDHPRWRLCKANFKYDLCPSYPALLMVPAALSDDVIKDAATFRSKNRFPALTWLHPRTGAALCRSSQPNTGVLRSNNLNDRDLIWSIRDAAIPVEAAWRSTQACPKKSSLLHIVDARPEINAKSNALAGKGHESVKQYDRDGVATASITFMGIDNIHAVRSAFTGLTEALYEVEDSNFFGAVQKSHWLEYVCGILQGASEVATHLERGDAVLVHCSDGWDRTAQLASLAQLMLDPFFRTLEGFAVLVEKDWCSFGHMFKKRCGHPTSDQTSPIFQQFLDAVYQLTLQFPTHFQFNELFLSSIADAVYSSWYGTFQMNSERERKTFLLNVPSVSVWDVIRASTDQFLNPLFNGGDGYGDGSGGARMEPMLPVCRVRVMQLWCSQYQKAISHMRLQQREYEMLQLIRQQETELSRVYAVISSTQRMELRAIQLRADIASLARSMNLEYPDESGRRSEERGRDAVPQSVPAGKRAPAASVDFHDLSSVTQHENGSDDSSVRPSLDTNATAGASTGNALSPASSAASNGRRKSISRSRSNSVRLKNSILSMIGVGGGGSHDKQPQAVNEAASVPSTAPAIHHHRSPSSMHQSNNNNARVHHDALKKELQGLESQIAKLHNQVTRKEDTAKLLTRRFRCYNYNLPESALAEPEQPSTASPSLHRSSLRHRASFGAPRDRFHSPSAFSPSSSSSRGSPSPSARRNTQPGNGYGGSSSDDSSDRHFTPGGAPLLTTTKVITSSFRNNPQPVWERDVDAPCCKRCKKKFKTFYRNRHHCRCCGFVFCGKCTNSRMNLPEFGYYDVVRVCVTCYNNGDDG